MMDAVMALPSHLSERCGSLPEGGGVTKRPGALLKPVPVRRNVAPRPMLEENAAGDDRNNSSQDETKSAISPPQSGSVANFPLTGRVFARQHSAPRGGMSIDVCILDFPSPPRRGAVDELEDERLPLWREAQIIYYVTVIKGECTSKAPADLLYSPTTALVAKSLPLLRAHVAQRPHLRKVAQLYIDWWRTAYYTSGLDVSRHIIHDMHRRHGAPELLSSRRAGPPLMSRRRSLPNGDTVGGELALRSSGNKRSLSKLLCAIGSFSVTTIRADAHRRHSARVSSHSTDDARMLSDTDALIRHSNLPWTRDADVLSAGAISSDVLPCSDVLRHLLCNAHDERSMDSLHSTADTDTMPSARDDLLTVEKLDSVAERCEVEEQESLLTNVMATLDLIRTPSDSPPHASPVANPRERATRRISLLTTGTSLESEQVFADAALRSASAPLAGSATAQRPHGPRRTLTPVHSPVMENLALVENDLNEIARQEAATMALVEQRAGNRRYSAVSSCSSSSGGSEGDDHIQNRRFLPSVDRYQSVETDRRLPMHGYLENDATHHRLSVAQRLVPGLGFVRKRLLKKAAGKSAVQDLNMWVPRAAVYAQGAAVSSN